MENLITINELLDQTCLDLHFECVCVRLLQKTRLGFIIQRKSKNNGLGFFSCFLSLPHHVWTPTHHHRLLQDTQPISQIFIRESENGARAAQLSRPHTRKITARGAFS